MAENSGRPAEQEAVYTTIVGGRPPGSGTDIGDIPRGIEVLVKKAAVDAGFRALLLETRAEAAKEIALDLDLAEAAMLGAIPAAQLDAIIAATKVDEKARPALLGKAAAVMIAALGVGGTGCYISSPPTLGIAPDRPQSARPEAKDADDAESDEPETKPDAMPDRDRVTRGIRPGKPRLWVGSRSR
ncbi:MAG: hypothetical protein ACYS9X_11210 [Planctomycetota bacterium]|jgi:hypothetical protein